MRASKRPRLADNDQHRGDLPRRAGSESLALSWAGLAARRSVLGLAASASSRQTLARAAASDSSWEAQPSGGYGDDT